MFRRIGYRQFVLTSLICLSTLAGAYSACTSLISSNPNVKFTASSSSLGPGFPVLNHNDVWCAGDVNTEQFLTVDLGVNLSFDQVSVQGLPNSNRSVSQYYLKISIDNVLFATVQEGGMPKTFDGPQFNGDAVVNSNLSSPVQARWVKFNPRKPLIGNSLCMRIDILSCQHAPPSVDGYWSDWSPWTACIEGNVHCQGSRTRSRTCSNPAPAFGGENCRGYDFTNDFCSMGCPVDGSWSQWSGYSLCNVPCNGGFQIRSRTCSEPFPTHGGRDCPGTRLGTRACNTHPCPTTSPSADTLPPTTASSPETTSLPTTTSLPRTTSSPSTTTQTPEARDGQWSAWGQWTPCTKTCGQGTRMRTRVCNNPTPAYGGTTCDGVPSETEGCLDRNCSSCGEISNLNNSNYNASSAVQPAHLARLNTSNPGASSMAWCRDPDDTDGYLQIDLGTPVLVLRVATKGQEKVNKESWVTKYFISVSVDGVNYTEYKEKGQKKEFSGSPDPNSLSFNDLKMTSKVQYVRFRPISYQEQPCMQASVFGCTTSPFGPKDKEITNAATLTEEAWSGILIAFMVLAGTLTIALLLACCCLFCNRGKKKTSYLTEDGYLLEYDKSWTSIADDINRNAKTISESEVQEVSINMNEEPLGVIEFEVETEESNGSGPVSAECVRSETPVYSEETATSLLATGYKSHEERKRRARAKSEPVVIVSDAREQNLHEKEAVELTGSVNRGFARSQEWPLIEPGQPLQVRTRLQEMTRSKSTDELGAIYREMIEDHLLLYFNKATDPDDNIGMQQTNQQSLGFGIGRRHGSSETSRGAEQSRPRIEFLERDIASMDDGEIGRYHQQSEVKLLANGEASPSYSIVEAVQTRQGGKEVIYTEITNDQLREDGFEIFNFEDGTVYAEVQFDRQVSEFNKKL